MPTADRSAEKWITFAWVFVLGHRRVGAAGRGAVGGAPLGAQRVAVVIPIVLVLQFISGVYFAFYMLPEWLQNGGQPSSRSKWMAQGMRYVFLPDEYSALEQGEEWNLAGVAIALAVWLVVGLVLAR